MVGQEEGSDFVNWIFGTGPDSHLPYSAEIKQDEFSQIKISENSQKNLPYENRAADWVQTDHAQDRFSDGLNYSEPSYKYGIDSQVEIRWNDTFSVQDVGVSDCETRPNSSQSHGFVENRVEGDGNCQFRAISDQMYKNPESHERVRKRIVKQLRSHPEMYKEYVGTDYSDYLNKMSRTGEWGDHVTLQAAADSYGVKILVMTSGNNIEIVPNSGNYTDVINLKFYEEGHYNSMSAS